MILPPDNEAINNIMTRVSIRSFTKKEIEKDKLELILRAAMAAPSADDKQPWEFIVIRNKETLKLLSRKLPDAVMLLEADTAITICGNTNKGIKGLEIGRAHV